MKHSLPSPQGKMLSKSLHSEKLTVHWVTKEIKGKGRGEMSFWINTIHCFSPVLLSILLSKVTSIFLYIIFENYQIISLSRTKRP